MRACAPPNTTLFLIPSHQHDATSQEQLWVHECGVGWGGSGDCCTWAKVGCDTKGHVTKLDLSGCGIKGKIGTLLSIETLRIGCTVFLRSFRVDGRVFLVAAVERDGDDPNDHSSYRTKSIVFEWTY